MTQLNRALLVKRNFMKSSLRSILTHLSLIITTLFLVNSCAVNPVSGKKEIMFMSDSQERALGLQYDPSVIANFGLYKDEAIQNFINTKGKQMGKISHRPELDYQFRVLDSPVVNAFAVPGGFIYFTRGILAQFNNEAEFAGVLGHEIGHVTARHSASQQSQAMLAQLGLVAGVALSEDFRKYAGVAQQGLGLLFLKFGRDDESQSDTLGVIYSTKIGYDAHEMAEFFQTLKRMRGDSGQQIPTFLSTHPDPGDRYNRVHAYAKKYQVASGRTRSQLEVGRDRYLRMIDGIVYGEDPRQGYFENGYFYHPEMEFQFPVPNGWQTANSPQQVQMAPSDGKAAIILTIPQGSTPEEAANTYIANSQMNVLSKSATRINGFAAVKFIGDQVNQQDNSTIRSLTYMIQYNNLILQFSGLSLAQNYAAYERFFNFTITKFNRCTDQSKLNRQPERVRIATINSNTTVRNALLTNKIPNSRLEEFAVLNGMQLNDQLKKGTLIKVLGR